MRISGTICGCLLLSSVQPCLPGLSADEASGPATAATAPVFHRPSMELHATRSMAGQEYRPRAQLTGTVMDSGVPCAGATVQAWYLGWMGRGWRETLTRTTTSDQDGKFVLEMPRRRLSGITFFARTSDGRQSAYLKISPTDTAEHRYMMQDPNRIRDVQLELEPSISCTIVAQDESGAAIGGAEVIALNYSSWHMVRTRTDAMGQATVFLPRAKRHMPILVWKDGVGLNYALSADLSKPADPQKDRKHEVRIDRAAPLRVKVVDAVTRKRLPDVAVGATVPPRVERERLPSADLSFGITVATNADGVANIDWLPAWSNRKTVTVWGTKEGYDSGTAKIEVGTRGNLLAIEMTSHVRLHGKVVDKVGHPVAQITVRAASGNAAYQRHAVTDADGKYELTVPSAAAAVVSVIDPKWGSLPWRKRTHDQPGSLRVPDFVLQPAQKIYGRADFGNKPLAGQEVSLLLFGPPSGDGKWPQTNTNKNDPRIVQSTWTDEDGHYEFHVGPGVYNIKGPNRIEEYEGHLFQRAPAYWMLNLPAAAASRRHDFTPTIWNE